MAGGKPEGRCDQTRRERPPDHRAVPGEQVRQASAVTKEVEYEEGGQAPAALSSMTAAVVVVRASATVAVPRTTEMAAPLAQPEAPWHHSPRCAP